MRCLLMLGFDRTWFLLGLSLVLVVMSSTGLQSVLGHSLRTIISESTSADCGSGLPRGCRCGHQMYLDTVQYVVNCTNVNLRNTSVLENMPEEVQVLIFTGNHIEELPWNVFGSINNYTQLKVVDMSNNRIRDIRGKSYHRVQNVERLILNHNNLSISRNMDKELNHHHPRVFSNFVNLISLHLTDAFDDDHSPQLSEDLHDIFMQSKLQKLEKLHLEQNEITSFKDRRIFCDLPSLMDLHLGDNLLTEINFDLNCIERLRFLDLKRNQFTHIKEDDLLRLDEVDRLHSTTTSSSSSSAVAATATANLIVDFDLNPFTCDCRIAPFLVWLQHTNVSVRNYQQFYCHLNRTQTHTQTTSTSTTMATTMVPLIGHNMSHCRSVLRDAIILFAGRRNEHEHGEQDSCVKDLTHLLDQAANEDNLAFAQQQEKLLEQREQQQWIQTHRFVGLIFLTILCSVVLVAVLLTLFYTHRHKFQMCMSPVLENATKKVQYTSIKDENCPEVHV